MLRCSVTEQRLKESINATQPQVQSWGGIFHTQKKSILSISTQPLPARFSLLSGGWVGQGRFNVRKQSALAECHSSSCRCLYSSLQESHIRQPATHICFSSQPSQNSLVILQTVGKVQLWFSSSFTTWAVSGSWQARETEPVTNGPIEQRYSGVLRLLLEAYHQP